MAALFRESPFLLKHTFILHSTDNLLLRLVNPDALLPSLPDSLLSVASKVSVKYLSALVCEYHKAVPEYRVPLRNRCRCCGHCSLWHAPPLDTAGDRREPPRRGWLSCSKEENVVFRVRKRRVTAANTSFSLHYKNTILEVQSQAFCVLFSREWTLFFTTEYTEFHGVFLVIQSDGLEAVGFPIGVTGVTNFRMGAIVLSHHQPFLSDYSIFLPGCICTPYILLTYWFVHF